MSPTPSPMPGSFSFDTPLTPKVDLTVVTKSHIFQPPSATASLQSSTASLTSSAYEYSRTRSRKRLRNEPQTTYPQIPQAGWAHDFTPAACDAATSSATLGLESPPTLANTTYRLAGGLDTPTAHLDSGRDTWSYNDTPLQHQTHARLGGGRHAIETGGYFDRAVPPALAMERNGQTRLPKSPGIRDGLGNVMCRFAGVAGKVWQNWSSTFRGFYAGGGQGYGMEVSSNAMSGEQIHMQEKGQDIDWRLDAPPTPGGFPQEDYIADYMSLDHTKTPPRATKRSKTDSDMSASWVLIASTPSSRETSPSRLAHRKVPPPGSAKRTGPKGLVRRPILPASRPSMSAFAGSPAMQSNRASYASPRAPITISPTRNSPVSIEVQRHAAKLRKKEAEEDANLKRFNQQLKAMIKEGKEALGTRFEIEEEDLGESLRGDDVFDPGHG